MSSHIQIFKLREHQGRYGNIDTSMTVYDGVIADNVKSMLDNYETYLSNIPESERYNLFFTLAQCYSGNSRNMERQEVIAFDIDNIDTNRLEEYIDPILQGLKVKREDCAMVFTGHGLHIYIELLDIIEEDNYFKEHRHKYKLICKRLDEILFYNFLEGEADTNMFSPAKMGRVPSTINKKEGKEENTVRVLFNNLHPIEYNLTDILADYTVEKIDQIPAKVLDRMGTLDTKSVLNNCVFLKWCKHNQAEVKEPEWYAMLSILGRLENGEQLCHEYSKEHPSYDADITTSKIERAILSAGPRTCSNIASMGEWCNSCKVRNDSLKSPVFIQGEEFIKTEKTGFRTEMITSNGVIKAGKVSQDDLVKAFDRDYTFKTMKDSKIVYSYQEKGYYKMMYQSELSNYVMMRVKNPTSSKADRAEFIDRLGITNLVEPEFLDNVPNMLNLVNGVLDLKTKELLPHSKDYGFTYVVPYEYAKDATCPRFDQFMQEITMNNQKMINLLLEFMGYCFSGLPASWGEKSLFLVGEGSNGKSVFINTMQDLAGSNNYSALTLSDITNENNRLQLMGKLFNVAEETPNKGMLDSALFKNLVTGGETNVKLMYHQPFKMKNNAKMIFACNELPETRDKTHGLFRRLLIVPFEARFEGASIDRGIRNKLRKELSGILNRVIEGYDRLIKNKDFTRVEEVDDMVNDYSMSTDMVRTWFMDSIEYTTKSTDKLGIDEMYLNYRNYMEEEGYRPNNIEVKMAFSKRLHQCVNKRHIVRFSRGGKQQKGIVGYKFIDIEEI